MVCGESTIDGLLIQGAAVAPLAPGANGTAAGYIQDLLRGHGYTALPDPRLNSWGVYGQTTSNAVIDYRRKNNLSSGNHVDGFMLRDLVSRPASTAVLGPAYASLVLGTAVNSVTRFVWLTSLFETRGTFAALNLNTDNCGVSVGILQWSQRPGQLHNFLKACSTREPVIWDQIIGGNTILDYTARPGGGVDAKGWALDPAFELTKDPWRSRLQALGVIPAIQRVQIDLAAESFTSELARVQQYAFGIRSERGFAFLLDLANQFGGARVAREYARNVNAPDTEAEILRKMGEVFSRLASPRFQPQVRARREFFRTTTILSDRPFDPAAQDVQPSGRGG
jgi:hypothetical protein